MSMKYLVWALTHHKCAGCRAINLPLWQRRCAFCDKGEGEMK